MASKSCPHYFIPEMNLFEHIPDDFLTTVGKKLREIRMNPTTQIGRYTPSISQEDTLELHEKMAKGSTEYKEALGLLLKIKFGIESPL